MGKKAGSMGIDLLKNMRTAVIDRIVEEMKRKGWKKPALANACGVKKDWVYKKLNKSDATGDYRDITVEDIEIFANGLDVEPGDLFPRKFVDEVYDALKTLPFIELMHVICQKEIQKYFNNEK